jgi:pimeloyl-ACP methyl ester carboxylesterase
MSVLLRATPAAIALAALIGAAFVACGSPVPSATPAPTPRPTPLEPEALAVNLDGRIYGLACVGPHAPGTPTAVLVGGLGVPVTTWLATQQLLEGDQIRTCAVDRPSVYGVPPGEERRTVGVWVRELRAVLGEAGIGRPLVLVGHSLGGLAVDLHAREHPGEVDGLVFLDAIQPGFDTSLEPLMVPSAIAARRRDLELNEEGILFEDIVASQAEVDAADPLPDRPAVVLTHGDPFGEESAAWPSAKAEELWSELQATLAAQLPRSQLIVAEGSGHRIQTWRPDLVADAIREVVRVAAASHRPDASP